MNISILGSVGGGGGEGGGGGVDGEWSSWSSCSKTCGQGRITRSRECDSPAPANGGDDCPGDGSQSETCSNGPCVGETAIALKYSTLPL